MLDNIMYEAQFCKVSSTSFLSHNNYVIFGHNVKYSVDFGPDFRSEALLTAANGEFVQTASELSCSDFDKNCRWRNLGHGEQGVILG
jgi:hypothetical protein